MQEILDKPQVKYVSEVHTFRIKPIGKGENLIICQFTNKANNNVLCSLLNGGKYGRYHEGEVPKGVEVMTMKIAPYGSGTHEIVIDADINNRSDEGMKILTNFWSKHPIVKNKNFFDANPNQLPNPEYTLEDTTVTKENKVMDVKRRREASQKYEAMGERGQKNVGYFFGISNADQVFDKDENELYIMLLDSPNGLIYQTVNEISNLDKFLGNADFKNAQYPYGIPAYSDNDERTQLVINTGRAIEKGIVSYDGKTYTINNHPVGVTPEMVVGYLETNKDFYHQYIIEKLGDAALQEKKEKRKAATEVIETFDLAGQRAKMKGLFDQLKNIGLKGFKVQRWAVMDNPEKIKDAIREAEEALAKSRTGNIETNI